MVVLTTAQVATVLASELATHGSSSRRNASCRLVRFDFSASYGHPARVWGAGHTEPACVGWREFWSDLQACGRDGWPQLIRLPAELVTGRDYSRAELAALLDQSRDFGDRREWPEVELVTLGPSEGHEGEPGIFRIIDEPSASEVPDRDRLDVSQQGEVVEVDHRQVVFIAAGHSGPRT